MFPLTMVNVTPKHVADIQLIYVTNKYCAFLFLAQQPPPPPVGHGLLIHEVSRSHTTTHHSR